MSRRSLGRTQSRCFSAAAARASGAEVDHPFIHVWTLRDGRGTALRSFSDRDEAVRCAEERGDVIQHVSFEVKPDQLDACVEFCNCSASAA